MPKSIWNGTLTFGMVNVPVKLYSATESKSVHFREVHLKDGAKIEHRRICPKEEKEVPYDEVVKGYEVAEDEYVVLEKGELKAAAGDRVKVIHLPEDFDSSAYEDTYRDAVIDLIERKSKGEEIDLVEPEEPAHGDDLAAALQASLTGAGR